MLAFWRHAETHYRTADGKPGHEVENLRDAIRPVRRLYGHTLARSFGPLALRAVRDAMIGSGLSRTTVNARINRVRRVFRWAASHELIPVAVVQALTTVQGLQKGRSQAPEPPPVEPVAIERVEAALPHMPPTVAAMVRFQLLTGCRVGEVLKLRTRDLEPGESTWTYRPGSHKTAWRGRQRAIPVGPQAQEIIRPFLTDDPEKYLFSPAEVVAEMHARRSDARKSKPTPSERTRRAKTPGQNHASHYDRRSYRQAIVRACDRAFPHPTLAAIKPKDRTPDQKAELRAWRIAHRWSPLQLRHTAATMIRARYGLEAAQVVLGHAKADVTQLYAERDLALARQVAAEIG